MYQRVPEAISPILAGYLALVANELPGFIAALYIHGSVALGAFHARFSDIDFVAVIRRRRIETDIEKLKAVHRALAARYPQRPFEGRYLQWEDLGRRYHPPLSGLP
jgi:predicted nucleotidyltransferase